MRAIGKLPKGVLILEFIGMMLLAVALLSVSDSLSLQSQRNRWDWAGYISAACAIILKR